MGHDSRANSTLNRRKPSDRCAATLIARVQSPAFHRFVLLGWGWDWGLGLGLGAGAGALGLASSCPTCTGYDPKASLPLGPQPININMRVHPGICHCVFSRFFRMPLGSTKRRPCEQFREGTTQGTNCARELQRGRPGEVYVQQGGSRSDAAHRTF